jgi:hypothetical protein
MAENGEIIVVAVGGKIPLVLRRHKDQYLFVGGCWLIESKVDVTHVRKLKPNAGSWKHSLISCMGVLLNKFEMVAR